MKFTLHLVVYLTEAWRAHEAAVEINMKMLLLTYAVTMRDPV